MSNKTKLSIIIAGVLMTIMTVLWIQKMKTEQKLFQSQQETRKQKIAQDSLVRLSDGYQKLLADTLTRKELRRLTEKIIELNNRKPISITKTVIQPIEIRKGIDSINTGEDSVFITDYYPDKNNPFLKYTNRFSLIDKKGESSFDFSPITLTSVVTKKEDGLYQIDFKGPEFLELKSLDVQTEPIIEPVKNNWGTLIGTEYGQNLETNTNIFEINVYKRYKKFYFGGAVDSEKNLKAGIKLEF